MIKGSSKQNNITQAAVIYLERTRSHQEDYVLSKARSDDDTYVRDAKQTELHHACRTNGNEESCQIKDSLFYYIIVRLRVSKQTAITNYENPVLSQREYLQYMFICTYNGFI